MGLAAEIPKVLTQLRDKAADMKRHLETYMNDDNFVELLSSLENVIQIVARYHHETHFMYFDTKLETATPSPSPSPSPTPANSHQAMGNNEMLELQLYLQVESVLKTVDGDSNYKLFKLESIYDSFKKKYHKKAYSDKVAYNIEKIDI